MERKSFKIKEYTEQLDNTICKTSPVSEKEDGKNVDYGLQTWGRQNVNCSHPMKLGVIFASLKSDDILQNNSAVYSSTFYSSRYRNIFVMYEWWNTIAFWPFLGIGRQFWKFGSNYKRLHQMCTLNYYSRLCTFWKRFLTNFFTILFKLLQNLRWPKPDWPLFSVGCDGGVAPKVNNQGRSQFKSIVNFKLAMWSGRLPHFPANRLPLARRFAPDHRGTCSQAPVHSGSLFAG